MKKIIYIICLLLFTSVSIAQSQAEIDKAMKNLKNVLKSLPPEVQGQVKKSMGQMPATNVKDVKKRNPQDAIKPSDIGLKTTKIIGVEGGEIKSANGKITLKFPKDALTAATEISIEETENTLETGGGNAFQLLPERIKFAKPVKLILKYTDDEIAGSGQDDLNIVTQGANGDWFLNTTSVTDTAKQTISANIKHFSKWGLGSLQNIKLLPKKTTLSKGKPVTFSIERWVLSPKKVEMDDNNFKDLLKLEKKLSQFKITKNEMMIQKTEQEIDDLMKKIGLDKLDFRGDDDLISLVSKQNENRMYTVTDWFVNNVKAPISNSFGSLTPQKFSAIYTAPIIIPQNRNVFITVSLIDKSGKYKRKLKANIELIDEGYFNYTVDGKETKTLQFAWSSEWVKLAKQKGEKVAERTSSQCYFIKDENQLSISTVVMLSILDKQILVNLSVKNPSKGQNLINCKDDGGISVTFGAKSLGILNDPCTNVQKERIREPNGCSQRDICKTLELTITEFDAVDGGTVAGSFSGTVYEENDETKKGCQSSIAHFISGDFSLIIKIPPSDK